MDSKFSMDSLDQEQYSFGPWLIEINDSKIIPPQYILYKEEILEANTSIKIPINADRKDVKPGDLMYKEILSIFDEYFVLFRFNDGNIDRIKIQLSEISHVINGGELLHNYIVLGTKEVEYRIQYYSVSYDITMKIVGSIRNYFHQIVMAKAEFNSVDDYKKNTLYKYFMNTETLSKITHILAYQKAGNFKIVSKTSGEVILNLFRKAKCEEVMFLTNEQEFIILSGDIDKQKKATVDYSSRYCYLKLSDISSIRKSKSDKYEEAYELIVSIGKSKLLFNIDKNFQMGELNNLVYNNTITT